MPRRKHTLTEKELEKLYKVVADYSRVSTDSEGQASSIEHQLQYFETIAKEKGYKHFKSYYDVGESGTKLTRDGFEKMLHDAGIDVVKNKDPRDKKTKVSYYISEYRNPKFGQIWMKSTSRFARNTLSFELIEILRKNHVYVVFLEQNINTKDTSRDFELKLFQTFDENESREKSKATRWGYERAAEAGKVYGCPYGYDRKDGRLYKNGDAGTVKLIFDLYTERGQGIRKIRNYLFEHGIRPRKGGDYFGYSSIKNILKNEKYAGYGNTLKHDAGTFMNKHYSKVRPGYKIFETDRIEPIITKEQYDKAQKINNERVVILNNKAAGRMVAYSKYHDFLECGECGAKYIRNRDWISKSDHARGRYYFYNCGRKRRDGITACNSVNIKESAIDEYVAGLRNGRLAAGFDDYLATYCDFLSNTINILTEHKLKPLLPGNEERNAKEIQKLQKAMKAAIQQKIEHPRQNAGGVIDKLIEEYAAKIEALDNAEQWHQAAEVYADILRIEEIFESTIEAVGKNKKRIFSDEGLREVLSALVVGFVISENGKKSPVLYPKFRYYDNALTIIKKYGLEHQFMDLVFRHNAGGTTSNDKKTISQVFKANLSAQFTKIKKEYGEKFSRLM